MSERHSMATDAPDPRDTRAAPVPYWYVEGGLIVYTAAYHLERGACCGSGCRHCPYEPRRVAGNTQVSP